MQRPRGIRKAETGNRRRGPLLSLLPPGEENASALPGGEGRGGVPFFCFRFPVSCSPSPYLTQSQGSLPPQWSQEHCFFMFAHVQCTAYFFGSALNLLRQLSEQK